MGIIEICLIAISVAMDAFAVSLCKGLAMRTRNYGQMIVIALFFGGFQAIMVTLGWFLGSQFEEYITAFDHWLVFLLLVIIGGKMIYDTFKNKDECPEPSEQKLNIKELVLLALATSIDALAVGISMAFLDVAIGLAATLIGIITLAISFGGCIIGNRFGTKYKDKATIVGGVILILIGIKVLLEHLGVFGSA